MEIDTQDDLRLSNPETGKKLTYVETLVAELKHRTGWIYKHEWDAIERMLPGITEKNAKEQCFTIEGKRRGRMEYYHRLCDCETGT